MQPSKRMGGHTIFFGPILPTVHGFQDIPSPSKFISHNPARSGIPERGTIQPRKLRKFGDIYSPDTICRAPCFKKRRAICGVATLRKCAWNFLAVEEKANAIRHETKSGEPPPPLEAS